MLKKTEKNIIKRMQKGRVEPVVQNVVSFAKLETENNA